MRGVSKEITRAYFSYVHVDGFAELNTANRSLFENFLSVLLEVSLDLENCTLQTGGKHYNVHLHPVPTPACEEPCRKANIDNFYFSQEGFLIAKQKGHRWS